MGAKFTLLTHFSARYGRIPFFDECDYVKNNILFAYDFMHWSERSSGDTSNVLDKLKVVFKRSHRENDKQRLYKKVKV